MREKETYTMGIQEKGPMEESRDIDKWRKRNYQGSTQRWTDRQKQTYSKNLPLLIDRKIGKIGTAPWKFIKKKRQRKK